MRHYLFDFFGTLVIDNSVEYLRIMSESFGLDKKGYKVNVREFISNRDFSSQDEALESLLTHLGVSYSTQKRKKFFEDLNRWKDSLTFYDGAQEVLKKLRERGSKIGILSNSNTFVEDLYFRFKIPELTDFLVLSHKVGLVKPKRRIYEITLRKFDSMSSEITMIGDQLDKDVLPAIKMGMRGILFDPRGKHIDYSGRKIKSLKELI